MKSPSKSKKSVVGVSAMLSGDVEDKSTSGCSTTDPDSWVLDASVVGVTVDEERASATFGELFDS